MNFYEELGLTRQATPEEIRQAYRSLSRLLHPDQQSGEDLRRLAEIQMKRLNAIHDILADPVRRRKYDSSLLVETNDSEHVVPAAERPAAGWWVLVVAVAAGVVAWHFWYPPRRPAIPQPAPVSSAGQPTAAAEVAVQPRNEVVSSRERTSAARDRQLAELRRQLEVLSAERDEARAELARIGAVKPPWALPQGDALEPVPASPARLAPPPAPDRAASAALGRHPLAGTWFYVRPRIERSSRALYPPEYIEAAVVEENGLLKGRYRARYRVADRPISPEVAFRFEGRSDHLSAVLPWNGPGGASGEVTLKLLSENSMEVSWTAFELGSQMGLASGTAVLVRRQEQ